MHATVAKILLAVTVWSTGIVTMLGLPGIALLMVVCGSGLPLPSELILPFAGYLVAHGHFTLLGVALAGVIGENIGGLLAYEVGRRGGRRFIARWGRYVLLDLHHLDVAERFFARFGRWAVLFGRMLPVVRAFVSLPAGLVAMPRLQFHLYTSIGSFVWCGALAWAGFKLGCAWESDPRVHAVVDSIDTVLLVGVALALCWFVWRRFRSPAAA